MSIPPLVCSTPPPPEQVECDDVGHDEFAVQYGSSQDDDDELCRYEDFQSTVPTSPYHQTQHLDHSPKSNSSNSASPERRDGGGGSRESDKEYEDIVPAHTKIAVDEDNLVEDLDLKFEPLTVKPNIPEDSGKVNKTTTNDSLETQSHTVHNHESIKKNSGSGIDHTSSIETIDPHKSTTNTVLRKTESVDVDDISETENVNIDESESNMKIEESEYSPSTEESQDSELPVNQFHTDSSGIDLSGELSLEREEDFNDFHFVPTEINLEQEILGDLGFHQTLNTSHNSLQLENNNPKEADEDFNDFDTFHINSTLDNVVENVLDNDPDPWKSEVAPSDDFGDFQATFSDNPTSTANESPHGADENKLKSVVTVDDDGDNDNDFGDFDNFKCSELTAPTSEVVEAVGEADNSRSLKSFDFKITDSESQIYERIEKLIHTLYEEQVTESQPEGTEASLECSLCETWGYLTQTEIRQPYMLNWNNSIGQKALLKSLCIDSRNILFGRKWSNMPRYAATLSTAPLQPVKQAPACGSTSSAPGTENATGDKPNTVKLMDTWSDSVASEGQEFTYAENLLLDLEHLMATLDQMANNQSSLKISELLSHACNDTDNPSNVSSGHGGATREFNAPKPSKPFPPTLALQPLRQINLPDTHIFTPTDSEVPRSKTIHYDNIAPIAPQLPQDIVHNETKVMQPCEQTIEKCGSSQLDNEYDDFQDFQDTSNETLTNSNMSNYFTNKLTQGSESIGIGTKTTLTEALPTLELKVTYQTQSILEPIKLEPTMPTLNWPEPGEVKETFDDFSDFVANSTWSNFNATSPQNTNNQIPDPQKDLPKQSPESGSQATASTTVTTNVNSVEDEFDNFQFVPTELPSRKLENVSRIDPQSKAKPMQQTPIVNNLPPNGLMHPMVPLKMQSTPIPTHPVAGSYAPHAHILQPVSLDRPGHGGQDKMNSQQILQPLSLESFSQINWPSPGVDLQDLSRFNPINAVRSLHQSPSGGKLSSPAHSLKGQQQEDDGWGDFVSIKPTKSPQHVSKPATDDDDWSDFVSSATSKSNGVNTISFNVHTNSSQKPPASHALPDDARISIPTLNYITPKTNHRVARDSHFQNL